jgi:hypothetical protein
MLNRTGTAQPATKSPTPGPYLPTWKRASPTNNIIWTELHKDSAALLRKNHKSERQHRLRRYCRQNFLKGGEKLLILLTPLPQNGSTDFKKITKNP